MRTQDEVRTHFFNFPRRTSRCNARREEKRTFKSSALAACCYIVKRAIQFVCTIIRVRFIIAALGASASASLASRESSRDQTNQQQQQQLHLLIVDWFFSLHCIASFFSNLGATRRQAGRRASLGVWILLLLWLWLGDYYFIFSSWFLNVEEGKEPSAFYSALRTLKRKLGTHVLPIVKSPECSKRARARARARAQHLTPENMATGE